MPSNVHNLRDDQPLDAPDAPGTPYSAWDYGHALARSGVAGLIGTGAYVVLHAVASHADKQANCQVGHACLARETGLSPAMVKRHLATLEACGALLVHKYRDEDTKTWAVNRYHVQPLEAIHAAPATQGRKETATALSQAHRTAQGGRVPTDPTPPRVPTDPTPRVPTDPRVGYPPSPKATPLSYPDKQQGVVPPRDISTAVDNSARRARARAAPPSVSKSELDPLPGWVQQAIRAIQLKREEETISARARELWAEAVQRTLGHLGQAERDAYLAYLLSDDYIKSRSSVKAVADAVEEDYGTWKRMGRPKTKAEQGKKAPKLPAHVQWEHDHAYNPTTSPHSVDATSSPTEIEATLADLRKYEGEESAQRWLRSIGLAGKGA